jgi:hypothetical protein
MAQCEHSFIKYNRARMLARKLLPLLPDRTLGVSSTERTKDSSDAFQACIWLTLVQPTALLAAGDKSGIHGVRMCSRWINITFLTLTRSCDRKFSWVYWRSMRNAATYCTCSHLSVVIYRKFCSQKFHSNAQPLWPFKYSFAVVPVRFV